MITAIQSMQLAFALLIAATVATSTQAVTEGIKQHRKLLAASDEDAIDQSYIVIFKDDAKVDERIQDVRKAHNNRLSRLRGILKSRSSVFSRSIKALALNDVDDEELESLLNNDDVELVEQNKLVHLQDVSQAYSQSTSSAGAWGLDRIDQIGHDLDGQYRYDYTGKGVQAYVIDTGVRLTHSEFEGRATCGFDILDGDCADNNGHGTHVAALVGGAKYGVAKKVDIIAVKVLTNSGVGTLADVIAGIEYVAQQKEANSTQPMVINISIGGTYSVAENDVVSNTVDLGVVFVTAAGNQNLDACEYSPSSAEKAVTVAAITDDDTRVPFSNYGSCVNIFAPGDDIKSAGHRFNRQSEVKSGTSMAAPHVAGVAALHLQRNPDLTPEEVLAEMLETASSGLVIDAEEDSPNLIVTTLGLVDASRDVFESAPQCSTAFRGCKSDSECCNSRCRGALLSLLGLPGVCL